MRKPKLPDPASLEEIIYAATSTTENFFCRASCYRSSASTTPVALYLPYRKDEGRTEQWKRSNGWPKVRDRYLDRGGL